MTTLIEFAQKELGKRKLDYWDVRHEIANQSLVQAKNKDLDKVIQGQSSGIGIRVLCEGKFGFSSTNKMDKQSIINAIATAEKIARLNKSKDKITLPELKSLKKKVSLTGKKKFNENNLELIAEKALELSKLGLKQDFKIKLSEITIENSLHEKNFASSQGRTIKQLIQESNLFANILAKQNNESQMMIDRNAKLGGLEIIFNGQEKNQVIETSKRAVALLNAKKLDNVVCDAILSPDISGVIAHEVIGHASEADSVYSGGSALKDKLNQEIGNAIVNISDQGNLLEYGSIAFDDEGLETGKTKLIEKGILKNYLTSMEFAQKMNLPLTGNARAQGPGFTPLVRMTNTFFEKGNSTNEEIIKEVKQGFLLNRHTGGVVNTTTGTFMFNALEVFEIKNGEIGQLYNGGNLSGDLLSFLKSIELIGNTTKIEPGYCDKGQTVRVSVGGSLIKIKNAKIGGKK